MTVEHPKKEKTPLEKVKITFTSGNKSYECLVPLKNLEKLASKYTSPISPISTPLPLSNQPPSASFTLTSVPYSTEDLYVLDDQGRVKRAIYDDNLKGYRMAHFDSQYGKYVEGVWVFDAFWKEFKDRVVQVPPIGTELVALMDHPLKAREVMKGDIISIKSWERNQIYFTYLGRDNGEYTGLLTDFALKNAQPQPIHQPRQTVTLEELNSWLTVDLKLDCPDDFTVPLENTNAVRIPQRLKNVKELLKQEFNPALFEITENIHTFTIAIKSAKKPVPSSPSPARTLAPVQQLSKKTGQSIKTRPLDEEILLTKRRLAALNIKTLSVTSRGNYMHISVLPKFSHDPRRSSGGMFTLSEADALRTIFGGNIGGNTVVLLKREARIILDIEPKKPMCHRCGTTFATEQEARMCELAGHD